MPDKSPNELRDLASVNRRIAADYRRAGMRTEAADCITRALEYEREATRIEQAPMESVGEALAAFVGLALCVGAAIGWTWGIV